MAGAFRTAGTDWGLGGGGGGETDRRTQTMRDGKGSNQAGCETER